jgi:hypothetical protein
MQDGERRYGMPYAYVDMSDLETDDMIEELESRGYNIRKNSSDVIYDLYRDYIDGKDFDEKLKQFFRNQLDVIVR